MSALPKDQPRRVIPRWRRSDGVIVSGEMAPIDPHPESNSAGSRAEIERVTADFEREQTVGHAADLLSVAVVHGRPEAALGAARFLVNHERAAGGVAVEVARAVLARVGEGGHAHGSLLGSVPLSTVSALRHRLHDDPRDALAWLDLSREYAQRGLTEKAERAVRAALTLFPDHRFVLRSAARFFLHVGKPDEAEAYLRRSPATSTDPWLMAAEIAVSTVMERSPKMVKAARSALVEQRNSPFHLSEVASSLATIEATAGNARGARKLFRQALLDPTENSVAQAEWTARQRGGIEFDARLLARPRTFEANAGAAYAAGRWADALENTKQWLDEEPFSGRAAALSSVIAGIALGDNEAAAEFARRGVQSDPADAHLLNNYVFMLAEAGRTEAAIEYQKRARPRSASGIARVIWLANAGLLAFRRGDIETGRVNYLQAADEAKKIGDSRAEQVATIYLLGEEMRVGPPCSLEDEAARVIAGGKTSSLPDVRLAVQRIERLMASRFVPSPG